ncbi:YbfB/YjiJ family MFS transporter [Streptomyces sp. ME19-03-3]|nr:YbfB/YjiJ family MFS transporter [Streptomyces sp. ME19-03-3]
MSTTTPPEPAAWRAVTAGASASFVGIGLARFAYTPLVPELINAHWFSPSAVAYLGAANLAGYLAGALSARRLGRRLGDRRALRWMMVLATLALLACSAPVSPAWFLVWRLASGFAGGVIMVRVAGAVLPHLKGRGRGLAGGAIFAGLGVGIAASGTLVPLLLHLGLSRTWAGLALLCALLTALSWNGWPRPAAPAVPAAPGPAERRSVRSARLRLLLVEYALISMGITPAMAFLADFVSRGLDRGSADGSVVWILYGLGALVGPTLYGLLGDRFGFARALLLITLVQTAALAALATADGLPEIAVLSVVIGSFPPGVVPVVLGRVHGLVPRPEAQAAAWGRVTVAGALSLALSAYLYSYVFDRSGQDHRILFLIGAAALVLALVAGAAARFVRGPADTGEDTADQVAGAPGEPART